MALGRKFALPAGSDKEEGPLEERESWLDIVLGDRGSASEWVAVIGVTSSDRGSLKNHTA